MTLGMSAQWACSRPEARGELCRGGPGPQWKCVYVPWAGGGCAKAVECDLSFVLKSKS